MVFITDSKGYVWLATHARDSLVRFDRGKEEIVELRIPCRWDPSSGTSGLTRKDVCGSSPVGFGDKVGSAEIAGN